jgi:hypothetical protein
MNKALVISGGAGVLLLVFGTAMLTAGNREHLGLFVSGIGFAMATAGTLGIKPFLIIRRHYSGPFRWFLHCVVGILFLMIIWDLISGVRNLYRCTRFAERAGSSIAVLTRQALARKPETLPQPADFYKRAEKTCVVAFLQLNIAVGCSCLLIALVRELNSKRALESSNLPKARSSTGLGD